LVYYKGKENEKNTTKMKRDNTLSIIVIVILALFLLGGFGMMGFGGMMHNYGISGACSNIRGIWCYWPSWANVFSLIIWALVIIVLILLIIWLTKQINIPKKKVERR
jgi:protein-S-isoprenylcysteine O-methyltransferase Ste14